MRKRSIWVSGIEKPMTTCSCVLQAFRPGVPYLSYVVCRVMPLAIAEPNRAGQW